MLLRCDLSMNWLGVPRRVLTCEITMQRCALHRCVRATCNHHPEISNSRMIPTVPFMLCASRRAYLPILLHSYLYARSGALPSFSTFTLPSSRYCLLQPRFHSFRSYNTIILYLPGFRGEHSVTLDIGHLLEFWKKNHSKILVCTVSPTVSTTFHSNL